MKRLVFAAGLLLCACAGHRDVPTIDISAASPADLEEVATGWELLPVDESEIPMPAITDIKRYGDRTFIKSGRYPDTPKIYMMEGPRMAAVLDAYGRGPGEYQDAESFAYCEQSSELIINDRRFKGFRRYHVPDMKWISDEPVGRYLTQFESLDAQRSVFPFDTEDGEPGTFVIWDHAKSEVADSMQTSFFSAALSQELHLTKTGDGSILFGLSAHETSLWRASASGFSLDAKTVLTPDAFGPKVWEASEFKPAFNAYVEVFRSDGTFGIGAEDPLVGKDGFAFWYAAGIGDEGMLWRLAVSAPQGNRAYSEIRLEGYPEAIQPSGVGGDNWCSVLLLDLLEDVPAPKGKIYPRLRELASQGFETVLLFWSAI